MLSILLVGATGRDSDAATRKITLGVSVPYGMDLSALDPFRDSIGGRRSPPGSGAR